MTHDKNGDSFASRVTTLKSYTGWGLIAVCLLFASQWLQAQTGGQGAIQGTVIDPSGAVVAEAIVTATDQASGVSTTRKTSSAGLFTISPLTPDLYTVTVTAPGFRVSKQENIAVNGLSVTGYNVTLSPGSTEETVTVTEAPPQLNTANAVLGNVISNTTYESLPVIMSGQQRDPTAFATLAPGTQSGTRAPVIGGTGNYLAEVYVDGIPTTTSNMQGDNRVVSNSMPVEAIDQLQVVTSSPSAEYQGAGAINFTTKSGGNKYHGQVADFVRNTAFDTWGFTSPAATKMTADGKSVPAGKPVEHQNEFVATIGGPVPFTKGKGFFFFAFDKFHGRNGVNPTQQTIPTALMRQGNFSELLSSNGLIYDPLSTASCTAANKGTLCRNPYPGNIIPASQISGLSQYEQKFLPQTSSNGIVNNYLAGSGANGYDNWEVVAKGDYDLTASQRLSFVYTHGVRKSVGYGATLPMPYVTGANSTISPTIMILEHSIVLTPRLVNQFKYAFSRFPQPVTSPTDGVSPYRAKDIGIGNLPAGQASDAFPGTTFATSKLFPNAFTNWTQAGATDATHTTVPNAYTLVDNLQWSKGRHSLTFGVQTQWLQDNSSSQSGPSGIYTQQFSPIATAGFAGSNLDSTTSGFSYASFLLGAVNSGATGIQAFSETGGRFHPISPYVQDDIKVTPKLTVNVGLRWDYLPPYHEVLDRFSFLNATAINSITGTPGQLQFAGHRGAEISCECKTPVHTYWKNWGPRLGFSYAVNDKSVIRGGFAIAYTRSGGVGGRAGDSTGTGQNGFNANLVLPAAVNTGANAGPSYYLNNSAAFQSAGMANVNFGGPGFTLPAPTTPSASALNNGIGNYTNGTKYVTAGSAPAYADPYLSGRAPEFIFFNFGVQRSLTNSLTISANYAGSESHFVGGATVPGFWSGQIDPAHIALLGSVLADDNTTNILSAPATASNIAIAQKADPSIKAPYNSYVQDKTANNTVATIGRMLRPFPQYSTPPSATWDNIANISYNSLQLTLAQREWKGLSYTLNYTYSKNIGDDGTARSAYAVPAAAASGGVAIPGNNRADRSLTTINTPQILKVYGVDQLPFGKGHIGGDNFLVRNLIGGWALAGVFSYSSGNPLLVVGSGCTAPSVGTCMPDINPSFVGHVRKNGSFGKGITAAHLDAIQYLDPDAFKAPDAFPLPAGANSKAVAVTKIGTAPRSAALNLWSPSKYNIDLSLKRSFNLKGDRVKFQFQTDCTNITNKVTFGGINTTWSAGSKTFGQVTSASGNRDFQFAGRITF